MGIQTNLHETVSRSVARRPSGRCPRRRQQSRPPAGAGIERKYHEKDKVFGLLDRLDPATMPVMRLYLAVLIVLLLPGRIFAEPDAGRLEKCERLGLLVLDYKLPDMTGADIVATLGDRLATLPVVMVTGYPDPVVEEQMRAAGVFDYIIKDMDLKFLGRLPIAALAAVE